MKVFERERARESTNMEFQKKDRGVSGIEKMGEVRRNQKDTKKESKRNGRNKGKKEEKKEKAMEEEEHCFKGCMSQGRQ